jgi:uncharacterized protein
MFTMALKERADEFLSQKRIAVVGVSGTKTATGNGIYKALRDVTDGEVFAVNPNEQEVEGDTCYPNVQAIPGVVDTVIIVTVPKITEQVVRDCKEAGVKRVWMHHNPIFKGMGSHSDEAIQFCKDNGIDVIPGACPMMFREGADVFHRCMCWALDKFGKLPA